MGTTSAPAPVAFSEHITAALNEIDGDNAGDDTPPDTGLDGEQPGQGEEDGDEEEQLDQLFAELGDDEDDDEDEEEDDLSALAGEDVEDDDEDEDSEGDDEEGEEPSTHTVTVNGEKREITLEEALNTYELAQASHERFREAKQVEREAEQLKEEFEAKREDIDALEQMWDMSQRDPAEYFAFRFGQLDESERQDVFDDFLTIVAPQVAEQLGVDLSAAKSRRAMSRRFNKLEENLGRNGKPQPDPSVSSDQKPETTTDDLRARVKSQFDGLKQAEGDSFTGVEFNDLVAYGAKVGASTISEAYYRHKAERATELAKKARKSGTKKRRGASKAVQRSGGSKSQPAPRPPSDLSGHIADAIAEFDGKG